jgi:hypothetical protein
MYRPSSQAAPIAFAWAWALSCLLSGSLVAQPTLRITSPADDAVVHPGDSLKVKVDVSPPGAFTDLLLIAGDPIGMIPEAGGPPYEFVVPIPQNMAPGYYSLGVMGKPRPGLGVGANQIFSKPITLVVERADEPVRLEVFPPTISVQPGGKWFLSVTGVFADGQKVDLKLSTKTIYTSDTPKIVTIDPRGVVKALAPGSAKITVSNGKARVEILVVVSAPRGR